MIEDRRGRPAPVPLTTVETSFLEGSHNYRVLFGQPVDGVNRSNETAVHLHAIGLNAHPVPCNGQHGGAATAAPGVFRDSGGVLLSGEQAPREELRWTLFRRAAACHDHRGGTTRTDLLSLVLACSPLVDPATTLRIISVESGGHPYAIHDNTDNRTYDAVSAPQATRWATALIGAGHRLDLGLMQVNSAMWLEPTGFALQDAFDPCTNVRLGTTILSANYARLVRRLGRDPRALPRALSVYNSGSESKSLDYARQVLTGRTAATLLRSGF